jgi:hypothetical protein
MAIFCRFFKKRQNFVKGIFFWVDTFSERASSNDFLSVITLLVLFNQSNSIRSPANAGLRV